MAFLLEEHSCLDFWNGGDGMTVVMYGLENVVAHVHSDRGDDDVQEVYYGDNDDGGSVMMMVTIIMVAVVMIFKRLMMVTVVMGEMPGIA